MKQQVRSTARKRSRRYSFRNLGSLQLTFFLIAFATTAAAHDGNGCGQGWNNVFIDSFLFALDPELRTEFDHVCRNQHDQCYKHGSATYCADQAECDDIFETRLNAVCIDLYEPSPIRTACIASAATMAGFVREYGDDFVSPNPTCDDYRGATPCPPDATVVTVEPNNQCDIPGSSASASELATGTPSNPYRKLDRAQDDLVATGGTVKLTGGSYERTFWTTPLSRAMTLESLDGDPVVIGNNAACPCFNIAELTGSTETGCELEVDGADNIIKSTPANRFSFSSLQLVPTPVEIFTYECSDTQGGGTQSLGTAIAASAVQRCEQVLVEILGCSEDAVSKDALLNSR